MSYTRNYEWTEYHKLYCDTYWGTTRSDTPKKNIIENRNKFATDYRLKSMLDKINKKYQEKVVVVNELNEIKNYKKSINGDKGIFLFQKDKRRHVEYYKTEDNKIVTIFSNYDTSEYFTNKALECGYSLIYPLYCEDANTFIKEIEKM
jgi:hypothetical protein